MPMVINGYLGHYILKIEVFKKQNTVVSRVIISKYAENFIFCKNLPKVGLGFHKVSRNCL
jgi:hypothetical protein